MSDLIRRADVLETYADLYWADERINAFKDDLDKVFEELRSLPPAQRWTPVTEGLPDKDVPVFVYLFDDNPYIAWINCDGEWATEEFMVDPDYLPKAWMPLPLPYKGGE